LEQPSADPTHTSKSHQPAAHSGSPPWEPRLKLLVGGLLLVGMVIVLVKARIVFVPLIIGAILAYLIYPLAHQISSETKLKHEWATAIVFVVLLATLIPIILLLTPLLITQVNTVKDQLLEIVSTIQKNSTQVITIVPGVEIQVKDLVDSLTASLGEGIQSVVVKSPTMLLRASETLLLVIFTLFIAYYFTADAHKIVEWLKFAAPPGYRSEIDMLLGEINVIWQDFFRGQVILAIVAGLINTGIALVIGLPEPLLMGVLAALLEFLSSVGHTIWLFIALALAITQGSTWIPVSPLVFALIVIGANFVFTRLDLNFLMPRIVGARMNLHPMVVIIGIIIGATVGGVLGVALAAPMIASLRVLGRYVRAKLFDLDPYAEVTAINPPPDPAAVVHRRLRKAAVEEPPARAG
jgi:predicted PurR-regulated permease PerM